jgi:hypothetical protein
MQGGWGRPDGGASRLPGRHEQPTVAKQAAATLVSSPGPACDTVDRCYSSADLI